MGELVPEVQTEDPLHPTYDAATAKPAGKARLLARMAAWSRFITIAPIAGLFVAAVVMTAVAIGDTVGITLGVFSPDFSLKKTVVDFIELADIFLLAIVLYIMSLGLYELFIDDTLPVPKWLEIHTLEDLKEKLIGVIVVVLAVFFLGRVIESSNPLEVLYLGGGISLMIAALGYFTSKVFAHKKE